MTNKLHVALSILLLQYAFIIHAQDYSGYSTGSWAGIHSLHINPANVVDSRYKADINLFTFNAFAANNFIGLDQQAIFNPDRWQESNPFEKYVTQNFDGSPKYAQLNLRIQGPSFMFNITKKDAIAFTSNVRAFVNADDIDDEMMSIFIKGVPSSDYGIIFKEDYLAANVNLWAEYGLTYGRVIIDNNQHFLKAGVTLKFLQGLAGAYVNGRGINLSLGLDTLRQLTGNLNYGHSDNLDFTGGNYSFKIEGVGFGADLGVVYEWRPKWEKYKYNMDGQKNLWRRDLDKYTLKASLALVDIGSIRYTRAENSRDYTASVYGLPTSYFQNVQSIYDLSDTLNNLNGITVVDQGQTSFGMTTPISLVASIDYQVVKGFYLNFTPFIAFNNGLNGNSKVHAATNLAFTVRYENPWFGVYMPLAYNNASNFNWGMALRLGPLHIGSGDIFSNLIDGNWKGIDLFAGVRIPIPHGKPRDKDLDEVSNRKDRCKDIKGTWEFRGCPDTDKDGIADSEDQCPTDPGTAEFKGCPDKDGDKIIDKNDKCPEEAGTKELQGCPDRDFDGVIDREDDCPDDRGLVEFKGCPDADADGLTDKLDQCPTLAGPKEKFGCPDTDGDGIFDNEDQCPTEKGLPELKGCPYTDTDKDGVRDLDDKCITQPGPVENNGCPYADTDNDGVIDLEDKCPTTPGVKDNFGCPPITEKEKEVLKSAFDNLEFATGKAVIMVTSYEELNELAKLLKQKPDWKLLIEGHTDNVGSKTTNTTLSKNRANAVKTYLVSKGIPSTNFVVKYYGSDKPIGDNNTEEGRQRNRRVEMTLIQD
jgi:outer membrane protein OmpA-like peptidoglycan-associated protein